MVPFMNTMSKNITKCLCNFLSVTTLEKLFNQFTITLKLINNKYSIFINFTKNLLLDSQSDLKPNLPPRSQLSCHA